MTETPPLPIGYKGYPAEKLVELGMRWADMQEHGGCHCDPPGSGEEYCSGHCHLRAADAAGYARGVGDAIKYLEMHGIFDDWRTYTPADVRNWIEGILALLHPTEGAEVGE
jgi:hypothetical protein